MKRNTDDWPTFAEAAAQLNASIRTMWRYNDRGILEIRKRPVAGRKPLNIVNPSDLEKLKPAPYVLAPEGSAAVEKARVEIASNRTPTWGNFLQALEAIVSQQKAVTIDTIARETATVRIAEKPVLKLAEAQQLTGIPRDRLTKAIEAGRLKAQLDGEWGRGYRMRRIDLDRFIAGDLS